MVQWARTADDDATRICAVLFENTTLAARPVAGSRPRTSQWQPQAGREGAPAVGSGARHDRGARTLRQAARGYCNGPAFPSDPSMLRAAVGHQRVGSGEDNEPVSALARCGHCSLLRLSWRGRIGARIIPAVTPPMVAMLDERRLLLLTQARIELLRGGA